MIFHYGLIFCVLTACHLPVVARPEPLRPRVFLNTTLSSALSTTSLTAPEPIISRTSTSTEIRVASTSSSSASSQSSIVDLRIVDAPSTTITTSTSVISSVVTSTTLLTQSEISSTSILSLPSTISTSLPGADEPALLSSSTTEPSSVPTVTLSRSSTTTSPSFSGTSTFSSSFSRSSSISSSLSSTSSIPTSSASTSSASASSASTSSASNSSASTSSASTSSASTSLSSTASNPCASITIQGLVPCIDYFCGQKTYYSWDANTTSTETTTITIYGNSTFLPTSSNPANTLPPAPCVHSFQLTFSALETPTTIFSISKTTATVTQSLLPPNFATPPPIMKSTVAPQPPETTQKSIPASPVNAILPINIASKGLPDIPPPQPQSPPVVNLPTGVDPPPQSQPPPAVNLPTGVDPPPQSQPPPEVNLPTGVDPPLPAITAAPISLGLTQMVIGGSTIGIDAGSTILTVDGQTITINPSQVIGPQTTLERPPPISPVPGDPSRITAAGVLPTNGPTAIVVNGISIALSSSIAVVDGTTFAIGPGSSERTVTVDGQAISMGPGGVGAVVTKALGGNPTPTPSPGFGNAQVSTIGTSTLEAVIDGTTFTISPESIPRITVINGQTISIGPGGIGLGSTTIGGPVNMPTDHSGAVPGTVPSSVVTIGHVTATQVGSVVAIGDHTFTIGPNATPTVITVDGETVSIGPGGVGIGTTTLTPLNPPPTQVITTGGATITEIGSSLAIVEGKTFTIGTGGLNLASLIGSAPTTFKTSSLLPGDISFPEGVSTLVIIGGTTFTIGPSATPTTDIYKGETISIGPGGVGLVGASKIIPLTASPSLSGTQVITSDGITYTILGSTIAIIGGNTFRIGPGATPVTELIDGQTISIGPGGVAFAATATNTGTGTSTSKDTATAAIIAPTASKTSGSTSNYAYRRHLLAFYVFLGIWIII